MNSRHLYLDLNIYIDPSHSSINTFPCVLSSKPFFSASVCHRHRLRWFDAFPQPLSKHKTSQALEWNYPSEEWVWRKIGGSRCRSFVKEGKDIDGQMFTQAYLENALSSLSPYPAEGWEDWGKDWSDCSWGLSSRAVMVTGHGVQSWCPVMVSYGFHGEIQTLSEHTQSFSWRVFSSFALIFHLTRRISLIWGPF